MHVHTLEDKDSQCKLKVSSETPVQSSENRSQESISQSNPEQRSAEPSSVEHFCGLTSLEGSVTVLPIAPVKNKVKGNPHYIETYALSDNGFNSTFCSRGLLERLRISDKKAKLKLTTMGRSEEVDSIIVKEVSDLDKNIVSPLHEVLSRPVMPVAKDEIPKQEDVERWPHLRGFVHQPELDSHVELLIGANVPEALQPREVIPAISGGPYATRVDLGWVINGPTRRKPKYVPSSCFFMKSVEAHLMCIACADSADASPSDDLGLSRDDLKFLNIIEDSVKHCEDGHCQISLPLKNPCLKMPENRV